MTWNELVAAGTYSLAEAGIDTPRVDARLLAEHIAGMHVLMAPDPSPDQIQEFHHALEQRCQRVPLQHITGVMYFRNLTLPAVPGVFITRPETEIVAGAAIEIAANLSAPLVVDLCTGSGAIALALGREVPQATVIGVEMSPVAYEWASRNAADSDNVSIEHADARTCLDHLAGTVDLVVSNPPYVPSGMLPPEVNHDPFEALYGGGEDGLLIPYALVERAQYLLKPGGFVVMEHDPSQADALVDYATNLGFEATTGMDLAGRSRYLTGQLVAS